MAASVTAGRALRYAGGSARGLLLHQVRGHCWGCAFPELPQDGRHAPIRVVTDLDAATAALSHKSCEGSFRESRVVAGMHEQTHTHHLQDQELAGLQ
jgi:hypothetical protein